MLQSVQPFNYSERKNYFHFAESLFFKIESRYISKVQIFMSFAIYYIDNRITKRQIRISLWKHLFQERN